MAGRVRLVRLSRSHLARTREWANEPELMRLMDRQHPVTEAEHETWFITVVNVDSSAYFAIETTEISSTMKCGAISARPSTR